MSILRSIREVIYSQSTTNSGEKVSRDLWAIIRQYRWRNDEVGDPMFEDDTSNCGDCFLACHYCFALLVLPIFNDKYEYFTLLSFRRPAENVHGDKVERSVWFELFQPLFFFPRSRFFAHKRQLQIVL